MSSSCSCGAGVGAVGWVDALPPQSRFLTRSSASPTVRGPDERTEVAEFSKLMQIREQGLRTRVMHLEYAIGRYLNDGDRARLENAYSNEWVQPIKESNMSDPFSKIRDLAAQREQVKHEWSQEVKALHAAGYSLRTIADAAGVSHDTIWKRVR